MEIARFEESKVIFLNLLFCTEGSHAIEINDTQSTTKSCLQRVILFPSGAFAALADDASDFSFLAKRFADLTFEEKCFEAK